MGASLEIVIALLLQFLRDDQQGTNKFYIFSYLFKNNNSFISYKLKYIKAC